MKKTIEALTRAYQEVAEASCGTMRKSKKEGMDPVGQADADINNDGKVNKTDDYLHNRRKTIKKAMGKKGDTATMNPKMSSDKAATEGVNTADKKPQEYLGRDGKKHVRLVPVEKEIIKKESIDMSIRDKLLSVIERKDHGNTDQKQAHDDNWSPSAKKMAADHKPEVQADIKKATDDNAKAEKQAKVSPKNPTDKDVKGDMKIINPPEDITKKGGMKESFSKTVKSIANAYAEMYAPKEEDIEGEEISELSVKTMKNYKKAATDRLIHHATHEYDPVDNEVKMGWDRDQYTKKARQHVAGIKTADKKIAAKKESASKEDKAISELSVKTMKNYKKAATDRLMKHATHEYDPVDNEVKMGWDGDQYVKKARQHVAGIKTADKKIAAKKKAGS